MKLHKMQKAQLSKIKADIEWATKQLIKVILEPVSEFAQMGHQTNFQDVQKTAEENKEQYVVSAQNHISSYVSDLMIFTNDIERQAERPRDIFTEDMPSNNNHPTVVRM